MILHVFPRIIEAKPIIGRLVRFHAATTDFRDQEPTDCEGVVPNELGFQTKGGLSCQQAVFGIGGCGGGMVG